MSSAHPVPDTGTIRKSKGPQPRDVAGTVTLRPARQSLWTPKPTRLHLVRRSLRRDRFRSTTKEPGINCNLHLFHLRRRPGFENRWSRHRGFQNMYGRSRNLGWLNLGNHKGRQDGGRDYRGYSGFHFRDNHPSHLGRTLHDRLRRQPQRREPNQNVLLRGGWQLFREENPKKNCRANQQCLGKQAADKRDAPPTAILLRRIQNAKHFRRHFRSHKSSLKTNRLPRGIAETNQILNRLRTEASVFTFPKLLVTFRTQGCTDEGQVTTVQNTCLQYECTIARSMISL